MLCCRWWGAVLDHNFAADQISDVPLSIPSPTTPETCPPSKLQAPWSRRTASRGRPAPQAGQQRAVHGRRRRLRRPFFRACSSMSSRWHRHVPGRMPQTPKRAWCEWRAMPSRVLTCTPVELSMPPRDANATRPTPSWCALAAAASWSSVLRWGAGSAQRRPTGSGCLPGNGPLTCRRPCVLQRVRPG